MSLLTEIAFLGFEANTIVATKSVNTKYIKNTNFIFFFIFIFFFSSADFASQQERGTEKKKLERNIRTQIYFAPI